MHTYIHTHNMKTHNHTTNTASWHSVLFTFLMNNTNILLYEVFYHTKRWRADNIKKVCQRLRLLCLTWLRSMCTYADIILLHWIWFGLQYKTSFHMVQQNTSAVSCNNQFILSMGSKMYLVVNPIFHYYYYWYHACHIFVKPSWWN